MDSENDDDKFVTHVYKKHQDMFGKSGVLNNGLYGNEYDEEEEDEESEDEDDQHQENVFNQQNAFGMQVFGNRRPVTRFNGGFGFNQFNQFGQAMPAMKSVAASPSGPLITKDDKEGVSMFKLAIRGG